VRAHTNRADEERLLQGERVQKQSRNGRIGNGMVVVDVQADIGTVFAVLTDLERCGMCDTCVYLYPEWYIPCMLFCFTYACVCVYALKGHVLRL
jgi:hypothetical protein